MSVPSTRDSSAPGRTVLVQVRTVVTVLLTAVLFLLLLFVVYEARRVVTWVLIALFLALALNPAVEFFEARGMRRGAAAGLVFLLGLLAATAVGFALIPPLVRQVTAFVDDVPELIDDLARGRGPLGPLEREYHIVERVREAVRSGGAARVFSVTTPLASIVTTFVTFVVGAVTIAFLTLFMLLEGRAWTERFFSMLPEDVRPYWRRGAHGVYRTVGGYVTGNVVISLIAGTITTIVLFVLGVPYSLALGLVVAIFDLIPLAGATIGALIVVAVGFTQGVGIGLGLVVYFVLYQQFENHVLQPVIYGRTVQLSPLAVLIAVLVGGEILGVVGALAAIPVAASLLVAIREISQHRADRRALRLDGGSGAPAPTGAMAAPPAPAPATER